MIKLIESDGYSHELRNSSNNKLLGKVVMDADGYYYYWPESNLTASWSSYNLREIANILDKLNSDYEKKIKEYFKK